MRGSAAFRASVSPGSVLAGPWVRDPLWRNARAVPSLDLRFADSKSLVDAATGANLVTFTRASSGTFVGSNGVLQTATNDIPRFDHNPTTGESLGLLVEEQRTNSIRNNTMVGAVAGTPGTLPTNWAATTPANGITREIVGTGTEDGINYIDLRFSGTNTLGSTFYMDITFDSGAIVAAQGQSWTESVYAKLIAGSVTGAAFTSLPGLVLYSTPNFDDNGSLRPISVTNARLSSQRFAATRTFANATTTGASPRFSWTIATGGTIDFTLRIGLPQLEQGAFATSVIPTTTAAATRSADVASITGANFSSWYNQSEGTVYWEGRRYTTNGFPARFVINDGTNANRIFSYWDGAVNSSTFDVTTSNVSQMAVFGGQGTLNAPIKSAFGIALNNAAAIYNSSIQGTDTSLSMPTVSQAIIGNGLSGCISCLTYWPQRLSNPTLQAITQ